MSACDIVTADPDSISSYNGPALTWLFVKGDKNSMALTLAADSPEGTVQQ